MNQKEESITNYLPLSFSYYSTAVLCIVLLLQNKVKNSQSKSRSTFLIYLPVLFNLLLDPEQ